ncbi:hypothetical protein AC67_5389 [Escherichia coli 2-052-05_S4_C1]|nr:hypothetical protein AC67_5389 [Escherichia coli 2-052-05_S4_C1]
MADAVLFFPDMSASANFRFCVVSTASSRVQNALSRVWFSPFFPASHAANVNCCLVNIC